MIEFETKIGELALLQESVDELHESLSSKNFALKDLQALSIVGGPRI
jgi:hypothetical protein